ncbi:MAG: methyltransferase domain-containing protein, partial [Candidatus Margulisbacteria bacterium]|nr:methyltransferase domain-containing protein [Candidatus Margulisiibacteriota bacterium]
RALSWLLPTDNHFWSAYSPIIKILGDSYALRLIHERIGQHLALKPLDKVLDLGCGNGLWIKEALQAGVARAVGVDYEEKMLAVARRNCPAAEFSRANLNEALPFANGEFTKIAEILVLGYLKNQALHISESWRVLAPGGTLAVVTPKEGASFYQVLKWEAKQRQAEKAIIKNIKRLPLGLAAASFGKIAELKAKIGEWHFYQRDELITAYRRAGFEIINCEPVYADQAWLLIVRRPIDSPLV